MSESTGEGFAAVQVVERLRVVHSMIAAAQAEEVELMTQLYRLRREQQLELGVGALYAGEDAATEIGIALKVSQRSADGLIALGLGLDNRYSGTREAFADGRIDLPRVRAISETLANASEDLVAELESRIVAYAENAEPQRVRRTLRRWLLEADPAGQAARRKSAEADRYVKVTAADDGTALLDGVLPAAGGQALYERLREMATTQCCGNDPRTTNQRRADALVALADGRGRPPANVGAPTAPAPIRASRLLRRAKPLCRSGFRRRHWPVCRTTRHCSRVSVRSMPTWPARSHDMPASTSSPTRPHRHPYPRRGPLIPSCDTALRPERPGEFALSTVVAAHRVAEFPLPEPISTIRIDSITRTPRMAAAQSSRISDAGVVATID
ncbi:DUF222 domain-containing protein [Nocardia sp. NPDC004711]